ncbi:succinylglutamate desuccinylase/aspartoacylase family protein [Candidatus Bathyarchaeota archaeon]|nr:succinylglutamate desuccinylase/aspartoacylase family protein [Candidatus Bathyarchaeota archaeon]
MPSLEKNALRVQMPDGSFVEIPYFKIKGGFYSPVVYIQAAQHGVELTGVYTIKLLLDSIVSTDVNGTIILVPVANPLAVKWRRHFYKMELGEPYSSYHPHQMNRLWPGKADGNETERIVYDLYRNLVEQADYVMDLHCYEQWIAPAALVNGWDEVSVRLAEYSLLPFIDVYEKSNVHRGMLSYVATEAGKHALTIEHSGQRWVFPDQAKLVHKGLMNVLRYLAVIPGEPIKPKLQLKLRRDKHVDVYAPEGEWIIVTLKTAGEEVGEGEEIAKLLDMNSLKEETIRSPVRGVIYWIGSTRSHIDTRPSEEVQVVLKGEKYRIATIYAVE